jgi:RimJ/RimL family protein N-acetyltransferase
MEQHFNHLGQPVGPPLPDWSPRPLPPRTPMVGRLCTVEPLDPDRHAAQLHAANSEDRDGRMWTYLSWGPFATFEAHRQWAETASRKDDPFFHAIIDHASGEAVGAAAYLRMEPQFGAIEVGGIQYSPRLQRRPAGTEAMYLMMRRVFDELGYRRYEWKCNSLNAASRTAAQRLGFRYEGLFRQALVSKGRNRDTAWFSIIDSEWPALRAAFEHWLDPANFAPDGSQRRSLASLREPPA